jgi:hypothetical protein
MGVMFERRSNSSAAVNPAGPAPAMTAIFPDSAGEPISESFQPAEQSKNGEQHGVGANGLIGSIQVPDSVERTRSQS